MTADRAICELCAGDERIGDLTPVHIDVKGLRRTWYFHNTEAKSCLQQWLREQRAKYAAPTT